MLCKNREAWPFQLQMLFHDRRISDFIGTTAVSALHGLGSFLETILSNSAQSLLWAKRWSQSKHLLTSFTAWTKECHKFLYNVRVYFISGSPWHFNVSILHLFDEFLMSIIYTVSKYVYGLIMCLHPSMCNLTIQRTTYIGYTAIYCNYRQTCRPKLISQTFTWQVNGESKGVKCRLDLALDQHLGYSSEVFDLKVLTATL